MFFEIGEYMGHRTKINVAVDGKPEFSIRGKLGAHDFEIVETLSQAMARFSYHWAPFEEKRDVGLMFLDCLQTVESSVSQHSDLADDQGMDVHVDLNFSSKTGIAEVNYRPDSGAVFQGSFAALEAEYNLD